MAAIDDLRNAVQKLITDKVVNNSKVQLEEVNDELKEITSEINKHLNPQQEIVNPSTQSEQSLQNVSGGTMAATDEIVPEKIPS